MNNSLDEAAEAGGERAVRELAQLRQYIEDLKKERDWWQKRVMGEKGHWPEFGPSGAPSR